MLMNKTVKIVIEMLIVIGITVPSIYLGVNWFVQQQIKNTSITVTSVEILDLSDNEMQMRVGFNLSGVEIEDVGFEVNDLTIKYKGTEFGNVSLSKNTFTGTAGLYTTDATVKISNSTAYNGIITDFINSDVLNFTINGLIAFTGGLSSLPDQPIEKSLAMDGLNGLIPEIQDFELLEATGTTLTFNLTAKFTNPTIMNCSLSNVWIDLLHNGTNVGNASTTSYQMKGGINLLSLNTTLGGNNTALEQILGNFIMGKNQSITLKVNTEVKIANATAKFVINTTSSVLFKGINVPLVTVGDIVLDIDITVNWGGASGAINVKVNTTFHNPLSFSINVSNFVGDLYFDDPDGYSYLSFSNTAQNHIFIDDFNFNDTWAGIPRKIDAKSAKSEIISLAQINNFDMAARLNDEQQKSRLYVDVENGILNLKIGAFNATLTGLVFRDIYVPA